MIYGQLPIYLGQFDFTLPEVMYYLYLPIKLKGFKDVRMPPNLQVCRGMVDACMFHAEERDFDYVYISARKGWATPDNPLNRPGWHCDGFGTDDLNFVWWDGPSTRFAHQHFEGIVSDHNRSLKQFDEQVDPKRVITYAQHGVYAINPRVVHATPLIEPPGCMRQYVKISMSDHQYNLENNSHNYLFVYQWVLHARETTRNNTQADFYEETPMG
jgi:hypothetical protein